MDPNPITPDAGASADNRPLTDVCFDNFELHPLLLKGLEEAGFVRCTPIQALTLPEVLAGRDVAGQAQTGTGKTAAFLVALANRLLTRPARAERRGNDPRAVILAPTRELAIQIDKDAQQLLKHTGLRFALIYGGVDYEKQRERLSQDVDVVVATPGRVIDYLKQHVVRFSSVEVAVLDEADRMFDLGFIKDIRFLFRRMPPREERQNLLFSATLSHRVMELAYEHMNDPVELSIETDSVTADRVRQIVYFPANDEKIPLLIGLLSRMDATRTIVFVNTKAWVERVVRALERAHFGVGMLSGDVPQPKRERLLNKFKKGELEILVATDVAARGLHIPDVSHVFNFDLPFDAEDYVHRIGRTARLGAEGDAVSFACELYAMSLPEIESYIEMKIPVGRVEREMLVAVPRAPRAVSAEAENEDSVAADDARATKGAPPEKRSGPSRGRDGARREGGPRRDGARSGAPRRDGGRGDGARREAPRREERPAAPRTEKAAEAPAPAAAVANPAAGEPAREAGAKRRRRGGRGRRRPEGGQAEAAAAAVAARPADKAKAKGHAAEQHGGGHERPRLVAKITQGFKSFMNRFRGPR